MIARTIPIIQTLSCMKINISLKISMHILIPRVPIMQQQFLPPVPLNRNLQVTLCWMENVHGAILENSPMCQNTKAVISKMHLKTPVLLLPYSVVPIFMTAATLKDYPKEPGPPLEICKVRQWVIFRAGLEMPVKAAVPTVMVVLPRQCAFVKAIIHPSILLGEFALAVRVSQVPKEVYMFQESQSRKRGLLFMVHCHIAQVPTLPSINKLSSFMKVPAETLGFITFVLVNLFMANSDIFS